MNRLLSAAATAATLFAAAAPATATAPIEGRWARGNMQIRIAPCGPVLCGTVVRASAKQRARAEAGSGTDLIGATLIRDIRPAGRGHYNAKVFVADKNLHANGSIRQIGPDRLAVRGCIALGLLCKSAQWVRVGR